MSIFYICWCGNPQDKHNFRHTFDPCVEVKRGEDGYSFSALSFPLKEDEKCGVKLCTARKGMHKKDISRLSEILNPTTIIEHDFEPVKYAYREIKFSVPGDTVCNHVNSKSEKCGLLLHSHRDSTPDHHFTTRIDIKDIEPEDKVHIIFKDNEDVKILWK